MKKKPFGALPSGKKKGKEERGNALRENIEAFIIAIIFALVLRYFCVEAFKIPTSSMQPTLIGNPSHGDRILVNKFIYHLREPRRGEVIVFKYPLNQTKNYIKRLWGLPGETIEIHGGDIYVNGKICRKSRSVQDTLWRYVYKARFPQAGFWRFFFPLPPGEKENWQIQGEHLIGKAGGEAFLQFVNRSYDRGFGNPEIERGLLREGIGSFIYDEYKEGNEVKNTREDRPTCEVGDVKLVLEGKALKETGGILCDIRYRGNDLLYYVPVKGSGKNASLSINGKEVAESEEISIFREEDFEIAFVNVDFTFSLEVEGSGSLQYDFAEDETFTGFDRHPYWVRLGIEKGTFAFSSIALSRDTYYTTAEGSGRRGYKVKVPEDCYFVLGDNSPKSKDSRLWYEVSYTLEDSRKVSGDHSPAGPEDTLNPVKLPGKTIFRDKFGNIFFLPENQKGESKPSPFVPKSLLLGRAILIFWPLWPEFRPKLIW